MMAVSSHPPAHAGNINIQSLAWWLVTFGTHTSQHYKALYNRHSASTWFLLIHDIADAGNVRNWVTLQSALCFCKINLFHQHQPIFFGLIWPFLSVARELSVGCCYGSNWRIVIMLCTHFLGKLAALLWAHVQLCCCHAVMRGHVTCHAASRAIELPCLARTSPHPSSCSSLVTASLFTISAPGPPSSLQSSNCCSPFIWHRNKTYSQCSLFIVNVVRLTRLSEHATHHPESVHPAPNTLLSPRKLWRWHHLDIQRGSDYDYPSLLSGMLDSDPGL